MLRILLVHWVLWGPALAQLCDQPFSPARPGWEWQYRVVGERSSTYSIRKTNITDGGFTQVRQTASSREEMKYRCTLEGIFPVDFGGSGSNRLEAGGQPVSYDLDVVKITGVAIPDYDTWAVGNSWKLVMEVRGTGQQGPLRFNISGTLETTYRVVAQETVTTPAGRFTAYKLHTTFTTRIRASAGPIQIPFNFESQGTSWYAENVGLVKSIQRTRDGENVTELVALRK
ncbi:MAG: hypothetical protein N2Z75_05220 [Meiothermus sp.]|uniref:TapB family protein n=1 Tax=Meiothermus sp. TaxID=1955249 RepID=UPI0025D91EB1|nr:hypothetical protein [Meiothermus sp.]MCS7068768.1 hypothetical protein [Meiothermus sp.]MCX7601325.1 hypothetical protein [Meiothermus sp.]MDW8426586.1 hypothetical protein [Meiothermus sp.]